MSMGGFLLVRYNKIGKIEKEMSIMKKTIRFLLVAMLVTTFVLPIQLASAISLGTVIHQDVLDKMEETDQPFPVYINFVDENNISYHVQFPARLAVSKKIMPELFDYEGTIDEWWEEYNIITSEIVKEDIRPFFEECGIDVDSLVVNPFAGEMLLNKEQINALANNNFDALVISPSRTDAYTSFIQNIVTPDYTAENALEYLQKVVGIIEENATDTFNFEDYNKDDKKDSADALFVLQCSVGKRNGGAYFLEIVAD